MGRPPSATGHLFGPLMHLPVAVNPRCRGKAVEAEGLIAATTEALQCPGLAAQNWFEKRRPALEDRPMFWLIVIIAFTLGVSFVCSLSEALILSTTVAEIEALKNRRPQRGRLLEALKLGLEDTISAILTMATIANTLGSVLIGGLVTHLYGATYLGIATAAMTFTIRCLPRCCPRISASRIVRRCSRMSSIHSGGHGAP